MTERGALSASSITCTCAPDASAILPHRSEMGKCNGVRSLAVPSRSIACHYCATYSRIPMADVWFERVCTNLQEGAKGKESASSLSDAVAPEVKTHSHSAASASNNMSTRRRASSITAVLRVLLSLWLSAHRRLATLTSRLVKDTYEGSQTEWWSARLCNLARTSRSTVWSQRDRHTLRLLGRSVHSRMRDRATMPSESGPLA